MEISNTFSNNLSNDLSLDELTYGIIGLIPLDINSMIFSGGLVFDAYWNKNFNINVNTTYDPTQLKDIDLFLFGPTNKVRENILTVVDIIKKKYGKANVHVGLDRSVITIIIIGIPRIVQLICTGKHTANEVIEDFDLAHVMLYWSNAGLYVSPFALVSMGLRQILPNPKAKKTAKFSRLIKYNSRGLGLEKYIDEFQFIRVDKSKIFQLNQLIRQYKCTNNLKSVEWSSSQALFNNLNLPLEKFKIESVELSGNFDYVGSNEVFLDVDYVIKNVNDKKVSGKLFNINQLVKIKPGTELSFPHRVPARYDFVFAGEIVCYEYNDQIVTSVYNYNRLDEYNGPYVMVVAIENPRVISSILQYLEKMMYSLGEYKQYGTTCLFDSAVLTSEQKVFFNVNHANRYGLFADVKDNFVNSNKLYIAVTPTNEIPNEKLNFQVGDKVLLLGKFSCNCLKNLNEADMSNLDVRPYVYINTTCMEFKIY